MGAFAVKVYHQVNDLLAHMLEVRASSYYMGVQLAQKQSVLFVGANYSCQDGDAAIRSDGLLQQVHISAPRVRSKCIDCRRKIDPQTSPFAVYGVDSRGRSSSR